MPKKEAKQLKTSVALDAELIEWVDKLISKKVFANRTHAIKLALQKLRESRYGE